MLSDGDWVRLDHKFESLRQEIKDQGSKVHKIDARVIGLEAGSPHKCAEAVKAHEKDSLVHNPYKAAGLGFSLVGVIEGIRAFFHK